MQSADDNDTNSMLTDLRDVIYYPTLKPCQIVHRFQLLAMQMGSNSQNQSI